MKFINFLIVSGLCFSLETKSNLTYPYIKSLFNYDSCCQEKQSCENLKNGVCDPGLNKKDCAWDFGDCGLCNKDCYLSDLLEGKKPECFTDACYEFIKYTRKLQRDENCPDGHITIEKQCLKCPSGTYSIAATHDITCFECTSIMDCSGSSLAPKQGAFRYYEKENELVKVFRECPQPLACGPAILLNNNIYITDCRKGYKGRMCHSCASGYTKTGLNVCAECPSRVVNILITIAIIIAVSLITYYLITTTLSVCFDSGKFHSIGLKIFLNYIQVIYLCLQYRVRWPSGIDSIFSSKNSSGDSGSLQYYYFSMKCLFQPDMEENDLFYYRVYFMVTLPLITLFFSFIGIGFLKIFSRKYKKLKHYKMITIIVPFMVIYPFVLSYSLSPIACESLEQNKPTTLQEIDSNSSYPSYLIENRDIWCSSYEHKLRSYPATIIGLLLWGIAVPFVIFYLLYSNRKNLHKHKIKYRFGFMFSGYLRKRFYWEFVVIAKKFVLVVLTIIMQSDYNPNLQSVLLITSLVIFLILHVHFTPYISEELNNLEFISSLSAIITVLAGIVMNESYNSEKSYLAVISSIVIFLVNVFFIYIWGRFMFWKNFKEIFDRFSFLKKFIMYHDGFDQKKLQEFDRINFMYNEDMQTVYTQIVDIPNSEHFIDYNKSFYELLKEIVKTPLDDYCNDSAPMFKKLKKSKSIYVNSAPNIYTQ